MGGWVELVGEGLGLVQEWVVWARGGEVGGRGKKR